MAKTPRLKKKSIRKTRKGHSFPLMKSFYPKAYGGGTTPEWSPLFGNYIVISLAGSETNVPSSESDFPLGKTIPHCKTTGRGEYGTGTAGTFHNPSFICVDSLNPPNIYVFEFGGGIVNSIVKVTQNPTGTLGTTSAFLASGGNVDSGSGGSTGKVLSMAMNKSNDIIYFIEWSHHKLRRMNTGVGRSGSSGFGSGTGTIGPTYTDRRTDGRENVAAMYHPYILCVSPDGKRIYALDEMGPTIRMIDVISSEEYYFSSLYTLPSGFVPQAAVVDTSGNLFYTLVGCSYDTTQSQLYDTSKNQRHAIYKINKVPDGTRSPSEVTNNPAGLAQATVFAGNATNAGYLDDPVGTTARFNRPMGLACDSKNNIYVADTNNNRIRLITPAGRVYTLAGGGSSNANSDYNLSTRANKGDGLSKDCYFSQPVSVAVDSFFNVYVMDAGNGIITMDSGGDKTQKCRPFCRLRKLALPAPSPPTSFTMIKTDPISATFSWAPNSGLTGFENRGFVTYYRFLVTPSGGSESAYAVDGTPYNNANNTSKASTPHSSLSFLNKTTSDQQVFYLNNLISLPLAPGTTYSSIKLIAFNDAGDRESNALTNVTIPAATVNYTIFISGTLGSADFLNGTGTVAKFNNPRGLAIGPDGNIYVADSKNHCIRQITLTGDTTTFFGTPGVSGSTLTTLNEPTDVKFTRGNWPMLVTDTLNNRILMITSNKSATSFNGSAYGSTFGGETVSGIAVDISLSKIYICISNAILVLTFTTFPVSTFSNIQSFGVLAGVPGSSGYVDGAGATAKFKTPTGIHYDLVSSCLYVADTGNHLIRKITTTGTITVSTVAGLSGSPGAINGLGSVARFNNPCSITTDSDGFIYVTDRDSHMIRKITPAGMVSTYSGTGQAGSVSGNAKPIAFNTLPDKDGASYQQSSYNRPSGIVRASSGVMYISEDGNQCIRGISPNPPPTPPTSGPVLSAITKNSATIIWSGDTGGTSYSFTISPSTGVTVPAGTIGSRTATFTGLTESTQYSINLVITNAIGATIASLVCTTLLDDTTLAAPTTAATPIAGQSRSNISATLTWTGLTRIPSITYTLTPASGGAAITGTMPANQRSPFTVNNLVAKTSYTATITGNIPGVPLTPNVTTAASYSKTSNTVTFETPYDSVASSALAQTISGAQASSAVAQVASQAVASSAIQQAALSGPVVNKNQVVSQFPSIKTDLANYTVTVYSQTASSEQKSSAMTSLTSRLNDLQIWLENVSATSAPIFAIAPLYQDRDLQFAISDPYLQSVKSIKMYDIMRSRYITIDSISGYIIDNVKVPWNRPFVSGRIGSSGPSAPKGVMPTDILLTGDLTIPSNSKWVSYFDTVTRTHFYVNPDTKVSQYEHPVPPVFSSSDTVVIDTTTKFLPSGWIKFMNGTLNIPYYLNTASTETSWVHPNPPPDPSVSTLTTDTTLMPSYTKYISRTPGPTNGISFYINSITKEGQWNFPDAAFNTAPSAAQQASSAVAQVASSAVAQRISGAQASSADAQVASSALAQSISGARESSAVAQVASSALAQAISGAQQSSAVAQVASSALAQSISGAQQSSAVAQVASQAVASSAVQQVALAAAVSIKDGIKNDFLRVQQDVATAVQSMYGQGTSTASGSSLIDLQNKLTALQEIKSTLLNSAISIFQLSPTYQDSSLQTTLQDINLTRFGVTKVFDALRNKVIFLDSNKNIVVSPFVPSTRVPV